MHYGHYDSTELPDLYISIEKRLDRRATAVEIFDSGWLYETR
jgi:hypothetical protein